MAMSKIKRDDEVIVLAGKDKGKRGKVLKIVDEGKVIVGGIQLVKKHQKPNPQLGVQGGIIEREAPIHVSNIAIFNSETNKGDKVGFKMSEDKKKIRFFKSTGESIDN